MKRTKKNNILINSIENYININSRNYILLIILLFIGLSIGIIVVNHTNITGQEEIKEYINEFVTSLQKADAIQTPIIICKAVKQNIIFILLLFLSGLIVIGLPFIYILIIYKGFCFGYTLSSVFATLTFWYREMVILLILIPYVIYFPALISSAISSLNIIRKIIDYRRTTSLKAEIMKHAVLCFLSLFFMIIASVIEMYIFILARPIIINYIQ